MFKVVTDRHLNFITVRSSGAAEFHEIHEFIKEFTHAVSILKPGFYIIIDVGDFVPPKIGMPQIVRTMQEHVIKKKVRGVFRVVRNGIAYLILKRAAPEKNLPYMVTEVGSIMEGINCVQNIYFSALR